MGDWPKSRVTVVVFLIREMWCTDKVSTSGVMFLELCVTVYYGVRVTVRSSSHYLTVPIFFLLRYTMT